MKLHQHRQFMHNARMRKMLACFSAATVAFITIPSWAGHAYSLWGEIKYPPGFAHFDYVNPKAPKGGELTAVSNLRVSTFDKYNPFTLKGTAPAYLSNLLFETLLTGAMDEPGTGYGLLAEDVVVAPDGLSATFRLRKEARFHHGKPVLAADVKHSLDTLKSKFAAPGYRTLLEEVDRAEVVDERTVRFVFKTKNRELPLTVGGIPIFSRDWGMDEKTGKAKPFDQIITDTPIASGPYKIGPVKFGKDITYLRDANYWGRDLNVNVGQNNFDRITIKIYRDNTARLEGLKAGEFDFMQFYSAGDWARRVSGKRFDRGELVKGEFKHRQPAGFQSYIFNARRDKFKDVRVREAIGLAMDFNWMSRMMFYGLYARGNGLFGNTDCQAKGAPSADELKLMEPLRANIPAAAFGPMTVPPNSDGQDRLRENLRRALQLLAEAGWTVQNGQLKNAKGERMVIELLDSSEAGSRTHSAFVRNLAKLGIELRMRIVDFALYQQRLDQFDYDMIVINFQGTHTPGQEYLEIFGSKAADTEGSGNYAGVKTQAVDTLVRTMVGAQTKAELLPACRAFERVIAHSHYLIPQWNSTQYNVAYSAEKLAKPEAVPPYARAENWLMSTWWSRYPVPLLNLK